MCVHRLCCSCVLVKYMLINTAGICIHDGRCSIGEKKSGLNMSVTLIPDHSKSSVKFAYEIKAL